MKRFVSLIQDDEIGDRKEAEKDEIGDRKEVEKDKINDTEEEKEEQNARKVFKVS